MTFLKEKRRSLLWQLALPGVIIVFIGFILFSFITADRAQTQLTEAMLDDLIVRAHLIGREVQSMTHSKDRKLWTDVLINLSRWSDSRITCISPDGTVLGDSERDPKLMDNHRNRPEIRTALEGKNGTAVRYSPTLGSEMAYGAVPLLRDGEVVIVVRVAFPMNEIIETAESVRNTLLGIGALVAFFSVGVLVIIIKSRLRPLNHLLAGARRFSRGDFQYRIPGIKIAEFDHLARALNDMANQLDERIRSTVNERNERDAIFASMTEGVLAVDRDEKIISLNRSAMQLLNLEELPAIGREFREVFRYAELQFFLESILQSGGEHERIVHLPDSNRWLHFRCAPLTTVGSNVMGAVVVFNDITRLRKLESIRRDFVANVSHELKTPITAIRGFVETLLESASSNETDVRNFLTIIERHTERLQELIDDLLLLARIEEDEEKKQIAFAVVEVSTAVQNALHACQFSSMQSGVELKTSGHLDSVLHCNQRLVEEALINLIQNAIAFSEPDSTVVIDVQRHDATLTISVIDSGSGIAPEHLSRIFERFYRVDKSRSRKGGGSGLGLSIVKHIMQIHDGEVLVESTLGVGSRFQLVFPINS